MTKPTVMIVDDEPFNLEICRVYLENDYNVEVANSGQECLDSLNSARPDVILMDWMMPHPDGLETTAIIRKRKDVKDIPILMISAKGSPHEVEYAKRQGIDDYLIKPFEEEDLLEMIDKVLNQSNNSAAN